MEPAGAISKSPPLKPDKLDPPGVNLPSTPKMNVSLNSSPSLKLSSKGVENAKKRLRAFSIQKKTPITPIAVPKPSGSGNTTVLIGKLSSVKTTPKPDETDVKKPPKPPKPGTIRKALQDSHSDLQKKTLAEIEDMKRKMELVELGIPLGLICPSATSEKAMPTKAMPPIKSFLGPEKLDEIIREAKKAKEEGRKFKFDYQKLLPDYDNPFQKKKEEPSSEKDRHHDRRKSDFSKDDRRSDKYDYKKHSDYRKEDKYKYRYKEKERSKSEYKKNVEKPTQPTDKETDVNLNDYLVCDSWSLDNDDKNNSSSPKTEDKHKTVETSEIVKASLAKKNEMLKQCAKDSPQSKKIEKLQPVIDSFKYEIDPNDDEILDIFDEKLELENYAHPRIPKPSRDESPSKRSELDNDLYKDISDVNDDTFLESVINEIKQEGLSDDESNEKGLVEYDISPPKDESPKKHKRSATPDIEEQGSLSQRSDYSGYASTDSYRTTDTSESGYKSVESIASYRLSPEKELDETLQDRLSKSTVDSLEMWSFVLKICQPLLFRHDKNKCYKETRTVPKLWYTENPKTCMCVKDRLIVYEELEMCKMNLVDRVYGCDQIADSPCPVSRNWYPRNALCSTESAVPMSNEWEADDSQQGFRAEGDRNKQPATPQKSEEILLDREYQRFMEAVESKVESSRSTTPVRQESKKKRKDEVVQRETEDKKVRKINTEDWSQESEIEVDVEKSKKLKEKEKSKLRKRKHSSSTQSSLSDSDDSKKKSKAMKKKAMKKVKSKSAKRRRIGRKILKKLKEKEKKKKKYKESEDDEIEDKKKDKKSKRKKQLKAKKKISKKKKSRAKSSSSSDSYSSDSYSESDSESDRKSKKAKKKSQELKKKKSKKRKQSTSDSTQSEELFDVNILNNIKTERLTDDEENKKLMDFSPRRQKPREIINVKELQNDFVGSNIQIKKEIVEEIVREEPAKEIHVEETSVEGPASDASKEQQHKVQETVEVRKPEPEGKALLEVKPVPEVKALPEVKAQPEVKILPEARVLPEIRVQSEVRTLPEAKPEVRTLPEARALTEVKTLPEDSNISQSSSQESVCSVKEPPRYEKDDSFLRPSSQNSNYNFHDVITASQIEHYPKHVDVVPDEEKYSDGYEAGNYEMYEQLAMAYQSDVASQRASPPRGSAQRIETVVHARSCGEIKCDWRPGAAPPPPTKSPRPSRWGLKPGEVNIVLTGGSEHDEQSPPEVFPIPSLANRMETNTGYDEAYLDMYGASDRLQYGDCFSAPEAAMSTSSSTVITVSSANITVSTTPKPAERTSTLDARIDQALRDSILGEVAKEAEETGIESPEKGILVTNVATEASRASKRVSFADGYKPGQDSDVEEPPVKKRKKARRVGCAWPCPASHPDHVPLWDALPPPPPPPGDPPRRVPRAPGGHLVPAPPGAHIIPGLSAPQGPLMQGPNQMMPNMPHPLHTHQFDPSVSLGGFLPPEPPPALLALH